MLTPRLTTCKNCTDITELISEIDCKLAHMSLILYNNITLMLNQTISHETISDLLHYKRILTYKYCNPEYAGHYTVNMIASKVKILKFK